MMIQCKRVYEQAAPEDGYRVLVDRLWPRGVKKQTLCMMNGAKRLRLLTGYVRPFTVKPLISLPSARRIGKSWRSIKTKDCVLQPSPDSKP